MKLLAVVAMLAAFICPVVAQEEPDYVPPPPTGDVTITADMTPCIVHVLLDGTVTLGDGVSRSDVTVIAENGAQVRIEGGGE